MSSGSMVVPVVLWGKRAPTHSITCVLLTNDQNTIVTGSSDGQLCLWKLLGSTDRKRIVPKSLLFGHNSAVSVLTNATDSVETHVIVSASTSGQICSWSADDGACHSSTSSLRGCHTILEVFCSSRFGRREWKLICAGEYPEIYILDSETLEVLNVLKQRKMPEWIRSLCFLTSAKKKEVFIVALSGSGVLNIWSVDNIDNKVGESLYNKKSKSMNELHTVSMACNPFTNKSVLLVCENHFVVYDISHGDFEKNCSVSSSDVLLTGGEFVNESMLMVWTQKDGVYLYDQCDTSSPRLRTKCCIITECDARANISSCYSFSFARTLPFERFIVQASSSGSVTLWKLSVDESESSSQTSSDHLLVSSCGSAGFADAWMHGKAPHGLTDGLIVSESAGSSVTASLYLASSSYIVCGHQDGSIVLMVALQAAISQLLESSTGWKIEVPHRVLKGHSRAITTLLYPHADDPVRYSEKFLVSGSKDFTVRLWDLTTAVLLQSYTVHGGEICRITCCPPNFQDARLNCSVCSVASDHSVALLSLKDRKCVLLASCHTFPVEEVRWRPKENFVIVCCSDGTVYVWQTDTGHLDRCESGRAAVNILIASMEYPSQSLIPASSFPPTSHSVTALCDLGRGTEKSLSPWDTVLPLQVEALRTNVTDSLFHVVVFDTEALITILSSRAASLPSGVALISTDSRAQLKVASAGSASPKKVHADNSSPAGDEFRRYLAARRVMGSATTSLARVGSGSVDISQKQLSPDQHRKQVKREQRKAEKILSGKKSGGARVRERARALTLGMGSMEGGVMNYTRNVARLLLSCLHAWNLDESMDMCCSDDLGLAKPKERLSFGLLSDGHLSLLLPGLDRIVSDLDDSAMSPGSSGLLGDSQFSKGRLYEHQWQVSSTVTTQLLLAVVSLANTLMSCVSTDKDGQAPKSPLATRNPQIPVERAKSPLPGELIDDATVRAGWSRVAAMHCVMLPDHIGPFYRPPNLTVLAQRWQDSCQEIREAAQALLQAELRRLGKEGRTQLATVWYPFLPCGSRSAPRAISGSQAGSSPRSTALPLPPQFDMRSTSSDLRQKQATSVVLLGVITAEFQQSSHEERKPRKGSSARKLPEEGELDSKVIQETAKSLEKLLLERVSERYTVNSPMRRAMADLMGRGFIHWANHVDATSILLYLLELSCEADSRLSSISISDLPTVELLGPNVTTCQIARHALVLCAMARPIVFISTVAQEVGVVNPTLTSGITVDYREIGSGTTVRNERDTSLVQPTVMTSKSIVLRARKAILHVLETLIEKMQEEVIFQLVEVVEIIVHCFEATHFKANGLSKSFPSILRFNLVSYTHGPRRLAVGSRSGKVALYELKGPKSQMISAHACPITAVSFSPDGRLLATYSSGDSKITVWQVAWSFLGLSSVPKLLHSFTTEPSKPKSVVQLLKTIRLVWVSQKKLVLVIDQEQQSFSL